jgi:hypothetical protein
MAGSSSQRNHYKTRGALPLTLKSIILRQKKKNYGNSNNIFTMQKLYNLQKHPLKQTKILQDVIITLL